MRQQTLADNGFERFRKQTRREMFLLEMDQIIPWRDLCKVIKPFYPKRQGAGRPPVGLDGDTPSERTGKIRPRVVDLDSYRWRSQCRGLYHLPIAA